jgi:hypothetical protein
VTWYTVSISLQWRSVKPELARTKFDVFSTAYIVTSDRVVFYECSLLAVDSESK